MNKKITGVLLTAALIVSLSLLSACGDTSATEIDVAKTAESAMAAAGFTDDMVRQGDDTILASYVLLDLATVSEYEIYVSGSMGTPEELAIFKAKSTEDAAAVKKAVERRLEDLTLNFTDYRPEEMPKIENAVLEERGNYILFAVCPEHEAVKELISGL